MGLFFDRGGIGRGAASALRGVGYGVPDFFIGGVALVWLQSPLDRPGFQHGV